MDIPSLIVHFISCVFVDYCKDNGGYIPTFCDVLDRVQNRIPLSIFENKHEPN